MGEGATFHLPKIASLQVHSDLLKVGLLPNEDKCTWNPSHIITWLGSVFNMINSSISATDKRICTDHKLISFELDLKVPKRSKTKRVVYNFKRADWSGLKETLRNTPWDACIVPDDADASLENWYDLFVAAANDHIPKCKARSVNDLPWMV